MRRPGLVEAARVVAVWPEVAGPTMTGNLEPVRFVSGTLWVRPAASVWAQELPFLVPRLLEGFARLLPDVPVTAIRAVVAPGRGRRGEGPPPEGMSLGPAPTAVAPALPLPELPPGLEAAIRARAAETIRSPALASRWADIEILLRRRQLAIARAESSSGRPAPRRP